MPSNDVDFVRLVEKITKQTGYKTIELCWMTWLIQLESGVTRIKKYSKVLGKNLISACLVFICTFSI